MFIDGIQEFVIIKEYSICSSWVMFLNQILLFICKSAINEPMNHILEIWNLCMTSERLVEIFEGYFADEKILLGILDRSNCPAPIGPINNAQFMLLAYYQFFIFFTASCTVWMCYLVMLPASPSTPSPLLSKYHWLGWLTDPVVSSFRCNAEKCIPQAIW